MFSPVKEPKPDKATLPKYVPLELHRETTPPVIAWYSVPAALSTTEDCELSDPPVSVVPEAANTPGLVC